MKAASIAAWPYEREPDSAIDASQPCGSPTALRRSSDALSQSPSAGPLSLPHRLASDEQKKIKRVFSLMS